MAPSEDQLQTIIDTIPALAWAARPDGSVEFFNRRWLDYTGLSAEQAQDWSWTWQGLYVFEHRAHPHRRHVVAQFLG